MGTSHDGLCIPLVDREPPAEVGSELSLGVDEGRGGQQLGTSQFFVQPAVGADPEEEGREGEGRGLAAGEVEDKVGEVLKFSEVFFSPRLLFHPVGKWLVRLGGVLGVLPSVLPLVLYCWYFVPLALAALLVAFVLHLPGSWLMDREQLKSAAQGRPEPPWLDGVGLFVAKVLGTLACTVTIGSVGSACLLFYCRGEGYVSAARLDVQSRSLHAYASSLRIGHYSLWDLFGLL